MKRIVLLSILGASFVVALIIWWDSLVANQGPVVAAATVILAVLTGWYAWQTRGLTSAAERSAEASERSARAAETSVRLSTMPYIVPTKLGLNINPDDKLNVDYRIVNEGSGPALNVAIAVAIFTGTTMNERAQTPFRAITGSLSPGTAFPTQQQQPGSFVLTDAYQKQDWRTAQANGHYGIVIQCSDAADNWFEFVHAQKRNRTDVTAIPKPVLPGYDD